MVWFKDKFELLLFLYCISCLHRFILKMFGKHILKLNDNFQPRQKFNITTDVSIICDITVNAKWLLKHFKVWTSINVKFSIKICSVLVFNVLVLQWWVIFFFKSYHFKLGDCFWRFNSAIGLIAGYFAT